MTKNRFDLQWIGYCEPTGKIWGWCRDCGPEANNCNYVFFAHVGHSITLRKFERYAKTQIDNLAKQKLSNKYIPITFKELIALWPKFMTELENKFTFDKLADKI